MRWRRLWVPASLVSFLASVFLAAGCSGNGSQEGSTAADDAVRVAGVTLVPVRGAVRSQCRTTARALGYGVPCPTLLPEGAQPTPVAGPLASSPFADDFIHPGYRGFNRWAFLTVDFPVDDLEGHLVISAAPTPVDARHFAYLEPTPGENVVVEGAFRFRGQRAEWVRVPQSSSSIFGGHTVLLWSKAGHSYGVGFHGVGTRVRELNRVVAAGVELIGP